MIEYFVSMLVSFVSTFGVTYFYCKLCSISFRFNIFAIFWIIIGSFALATVRILNLNFLGTFLYFVFYPILFNNLNKISLDKQFYYTVVVWLCGMIFDYLSMIIVLFLQNVIDFNIYSNLSRIVLTFIVFFMFIILANIKRFNNFINNLYVKVGKINFFDFVLVCFAIFVILVGMAIFLNLDNLDLSILLMAIIILLSFSFVLLIRVKTYLVENKIFLEFLKKNNEFYLKIEDENRIFKHNLTAKLLSVKSVSDKKARKLLDDLIKSYNNNMDFSLQIKDMPYGLNGIIYEKVYPYIGKIDIKIDNKINFDIFKKLKPRRYNVFVEKMIIAIDNAIESCITSVDKVLIINLYSEEDNIIMDIKNTFSSDLNLEELGNINYTTKAKGNGKRRGLGLFSALRDNEVKLSIKIINNLFVTRIVAKKNLSEK